MKLDFLKDSKFLCFAAGAATVLAGKKILKSQKVRQVCVCQDLQKV